MATKPRGDAKLLNLPEAQQAQLCDWLLSGLKYWQVLALVKKEWQVDTSIGALSRFYSSVCSAALVARRRRAVTTADEIAAEAARTPGQFDAATIDALRQQAFELAINPGCNPKDVKALFTLLLKAKDQELEREKLDDARKDSREKALEALAAEAKGNARAEAALAEFIAALQPPAP